ncbi:MAG: hypothetical protein ACC628_13960 [Pirellulaceae bacterium]
MKRLVVLAIFATVGLSLAGCSQTWPRWSWYRGDPCNVSPTYESMPAVMGQEYMAPTPSAEVLPGPVHSESST